jgi:AcrR family transcriptional regulator
MSTVAERAPERVRDAERSRSAMLAAAERLFAERGYDGTSLSDIGGAAGLSRGAPSYFFGSKARLYSEVLAAVFGSRQEAAAQAFAPVRGWCEGVDPVDALEDGLRSAAGGYMRHLDGHPSFVALIMREDLDGGERLSAASRSSTAMLDAFAAVRKAGPRRGVRAFRVEEAVLLFTALTFTPFSYRHTLMPALGIDLASARDLRRQARLTADQLMHLLRG